MPLKDPVARAEYNRQWREKRREQQREYQREYKRKRRKEAAFKAKEKSYRQANAGKILKQQAKWLKTENGKKYNCKKSRRERLRQYDLTLEQYDALLKKQKHRCKCCGVHDDDVKHSLHVDHDHESGEVRGLICQKCNTGIGLLGDTLEGVRRALAYLEKHYGPPKKRKAEDKPVRDRPDKKVRRLPPKAAGRKMSGVSRQARRKKVLESGA